MVDMNATKHSSFTFHMSPVRLITNSILLASALLTSVLVAPAQEESVRLSVTELQRSVYSAHLLTQLDEKPELDASLQVLLELQCHNPQADPTALASVLREAAACYRAECPSYIQTSGFRDEILSSYLDAFRQIPRSASFVPINLNLLSVFMLQTNDYATASAAEWIHAGNQRLLCAEGALARREAMVDLCMQRADRNAVFAQALDALLAPDIGVLRTQASIHILGINPALSNRPTMQLLQSRSKLSVDGSATVSTNELKDLFVQEMATLHESISNNLAVHLEILKAQTNLHSYLTNTTLVQANLRREEEVKQSQAPQVAAASAAIGHLGRVIAPKLPAVGQAIGGFGRGVKSLSDGLHSLSEASKFAKAAACGNFAAGALAILGASLEIAGVFQDPNDVILGEINQVKSLVLNLSTNMDYRFDQVDRSLIQVLHQLSYSIGLIGEAGQDVEQVRRELVDVQADLHGLERHLQTYINQLYKRGLNEAFNTYLGYETTHLGSPMSSYDFNKYPEPKFFTLARDDSRDDLSSRWLNRDYTATGLYWELTEGGGGTTNRLDQNLSYLRQYLSFALPDWTPGPPLPNPRDWYVGAYAYLQLALENPLYFRRVQIENRLDLIAQRGSELTNFLGNLTFIGPNLNQPLYSVLLTNYAAALELFLDQVRATEQGYADLHLNKFSLDTWRDWAIHAPRVTALTTALQPLEFNLDAQTEISAGWNHSLALQAGGTVVGWGNNGYDRANGTLAGANVVAISAGRNHSLALKSDGTVVGWGANATQQRDIPAGENHDIVAISAGYNHSLAIRGDGSVVGWGSDASGQRDAPAAATNVVAISAGTTHSLALRADGAVVGWGVNTWRQTDGATAGGAVLDIAAADESSLVLKSDGWAGGWGRVKWALVSPPSWVTNAVAMAIGQWHGLALRADGTVVGWGLNNWGQATGVPSPSPYSATGVVAIAGPPVTGISAGGYSTDVHFGHSLAARADGSVTAWGHNGEGQSSVPASLAAPQGSLKWVTSTALTATNATTNVADALLFNGPTWATSTPPLGAPAGYALSLDGVDDHAAVAPGIWFSNDFTIETWVWERSYKPWSRVIDFGNGASANNVCLALSEGTTGKPVLSVFTDTVSHPVVAPQPIPLKQWVHLAATLRGNTATIYIDGVAVATNTVEPPKAVHRAKNYIGRSNWAADAHAHAMLDDLRIWNVARTGSQIREAMGHRLHGRESGLVAYWTFDDGPGPSLSELTSGALRVAAGQDFSLALRRDGTVMAWGINSLDQCRVPVRLSGVVEIAAGQAHSLALRKDGSVTAWGWNGNHQADVPERAREDIVSVSAGGMHSLALKSDGTVVAWGANNAGQGAVPKDLDDVAEVSAGGQHNLALKANGTVRAWGANFAGQTRVPSNLINVVAVAAGENHSLALQAIGGANGRVVAWGWNAYGQLSVPVEAQSGVVAIAARKDHSLALKADGTVVAWGCNTHGQTRLGSGLSNVVAMAAGWRHNVFLTAENPSQGAENGAISYVSAKIPDLISRRWLHAVNTNLLSELGMAGDLATQSIRLSGAKALFHAVLELGLPYTMERDDVLRGFFYGTEPLTDLEVAKGLLSAETERILTNPCTPPLVLGEVIKARFTCFANRLNERLMDLQASGRPEIPRLVGHTLRLLNLLRDAYPTTPPPSLEIWDSSPSPSLLLHGEPYMHYALQYSDTLNAPEWSPSTITNLHTEQWVFPPLSTGAQRFYRAVLPAH